MSDNLAISIVVSTCACVLGWAIWVVAVNIRRSRWSRFCVFYEQTAHKLRAYLRSVLTDDVTLVDDILQESYFRFLKADLPAGMDPAWRKNYIYRIATNLVRDHRRSRQVEQLPEEKEYSAQMLLAGVGLYGVLSYAVAERTAEIGLRMALGAPPSDVLWLVLSECFGLAAAGVGCGILLAVAATRLLSRLLYGLKALDPSTIATATLVLIAVAMLAGWFPARRASRMDPLAALRRE